MNVSGEWREWGKGGGAVEGRVMKDEGMEGEEGGLSPFPILCDEEPRVLMVDVV